MNDLPIDKLGPFPILQAAAAFLILCGVAFAVYRGNRDRRPSEATLSGQRYFFDGPVGEGLKLLRDIRNIANETKEHVEPLGELARNAIREMAEIKSEMKEMKEIKTTRRH